ncbi:MAG TPA: HopJ type III effector protein [Flavobacterium sp.]|uniref:HopJ type III effector protein n=1 Tax=Flavobacterium sp. TaxID=239 RepID=UPI002D16943E|nr:HopJ type III effector protein [Flavobacterium sp.]HSD13154.1 HopJ type III effector protein [Flavobacterium sp.]
MNVTELLEKVSSHAVLPFSEVIETIDAHYDFVPSAFKNGETFNEEGVNNGSCKVYSFAKMNQLKEAETLFLFGEHYQKVLETPEETDHQNIRNFMKFGWSGIVFEKTALTAK